MIIPRGVDPWLFELATQAFHAAQRGDYNESARVIMTIGSKFGGPALCEAMQAWADTCLHAQGIHERGHASRPVWCNSDTGAVDIGFAEVCREVRWSGQLLAARAADDQATWDALILAVPDDMTAISDHVCAFLATCAATTAKAMQS